MHAAGRMHRVSRSMDAPARPVTAPRRLASLDTELTADVVAFCPYEGRRHLLLLNQPTAQKRRLVLACSPSRLVGLVVRLPGLEARGDETPAHLEPQHE